MPLQRSLLRRIAKEAADGVDDAMEAYREGRVTDEPHVTDRMLGAIETRLRAFRAAGVQVGAVTLRSGSGLAAEERRHGADAMLVLDIRTSDQHVRKGLLLQAKRAEPAQALVHHEWNRMVGQCEAMLSRTPSAYVITYSRDAGALLAPAADVVGYSGRDLRSVRSHMPRRFFEEFLLCFIGDRRLLRPHVSVLDELARVDAREALEITLVERGMRAQETD